jgi:hypothetical protein
MSEEPKRLITAPDRDYGCHFKILLVDFEYDQLVQISEIINRLPGTVTVFAFGSNDDDYAWCLEQANESHSVLVNMLHVGQIEVLKGFLLARPNVFYMGACKMDKLLRNKIVDQNLWLALEYTKFQKEENNGS